MVKLKGQRAFVIVGIALFFSIFAGVGPVGAMEILQEFPGEGLEGLKKFK